MPWAGGSSSYIDDMATPLGYALAALATPLVLAAWSVAKLWCDVVLSLGCCSGRSWVLQRLLKWAATATTAAKTNSTHPA